MQSLFLSSYFMESKNRVLVYLLIGVFAAALLIGVVFYSSDDLFQNSQTSTFHESI